VAVLLMLLVHSAIGQGVLAQAQRGGRLTIALRSDPVTLDPVPVTSAESRTIFRAVYDPLLELDENLNIVPWLAERWGVSSDGKVYTFFLRRGVKFHDGTDFNAEAVKINFERILNPANRSPLRADFLSVQSVEVVDAYTVRILLREPFTPFLALLVDWHGYIASPAALERYGRDFIRNPVGTGPFRFVEWLRDDHVTFGRNPRYWRRGVPYVDELVFRIIPDDTVRLTMLRTGQVDVDTWVDSRDVRKVRASPQLQLLMVDTSLGFDLIRLNTRRPPFNNKLVRQAFAWAVDREAIGKVIYGGLGLPAVGPIPPRLWGFDPALRGYTFDPSRARALLEQGGLSRGVTFTMQVRNVPQDLARGQLIQQQLAQVGMQVSIEAVDFGTFRTNETRGEFQASQSFWSGRVDPDGNMFRHFHTSSIQGGLNFMGYSNPEVDRLLDRAREVFDREQRRQLYIQAQRLILDDAPMIFTYYFPVIKAAHRRVQNLTILPDPSVIFYREAWIKR